MDKEDEFPTEGAKIAFALSYCKGGTVGTWVDWMFSLITDHAPEAPCTIEDFYGYLNAFFGDPDKEAMARMNWTNSINREESNLVTEFQGLAWKPVIHSSHRFLVWVPENALRYP